MKRKVYPGACRNCGGKVIDRLITKLVTVDGHLHQFENVPMKFCTQCGERVFHASVAKQLERLARGRTPVKRRISVPVIDYVPAETKAVS